MQFAAGDGRGGEKEQRTGTYFFATEICIFLPSGHRLQWHKNGVKAPPAAAGNSTATLENYGSKKTLQQHCLLLPASS